MRTIAEDLYLDLIYYETIAAKQTTNYAIRARYILIHPNVLFKLKREKKNLITTMYKTDHLEVDEEKKTIYATESPVHTVYMFRDVPLVETHAVDENKRWDIIV